MQDAAVVTSHGAEPDPRIFEDPFSADDPSDEVMPITSRGLLRLALVATETGCRFERDGRDDALEWLTRPCRSLRGMVPLWAALERDGCLELSMLHGLSLDIGLDEDDGAEAPALPSYPACTDAMPWYCGGATSMPASGGAASVEVTGLPRDGGSTGPVAGVRAGDLLGGEWPRGASRLRLDARMVEWPDGTTAEPRPRRARHQGGRAVRASDARTHPAAHGPVPDRDMVPSRPSRAAGCRA